MKLSGVEEKVKIIKDESHPGNGILCRELTTIDTRWWRSWGDSKQTKKTPELSESRGDTQDLGWDD